MRRLLLVLAACLPMALPAAEMHVLTAARIRTSDEKAPAADAIAMRCSRWLVEPPVACRPTTPLTIARSSMMRPIGR